MDDVLLKVGTIVTADISRELRTVLIVGKRRVKTYSREDGTIYRYRAWDYLGVDFPGGGDVDDCCYFDHTDIEAVIHTLPDELYTRYNEDDEY